MDDDETESILEDLEIAAIVRERLAAGPATSMEPLLELFAAPEASQVTYGTVGGVSITDEVVERLVKNAEAGFPGVAAQMGP